MSLINDALKKAQAASRPAGAVGSPATEPVRSAPPTSRLLAQAITIMGVILLLLSLAVWGAIAAYNMGQADGNAPAPETPVAASPAPVKAAASPASESAIEQPEADQVHLPPDNVPLIQTIAQGVDKAVALPPELEQALQPAPAAAPAPAASVIAAAPAPETAAPVALAEAPSVPSAPDPKIAEFVQSIQIRGAGRGKILLFIPGSLEAQAYAPGSVLDCDTVLRLQSIEADHIVLT
ncbi:MAG: hypothetical protein WC360_09125, partial [Opitutales bacterium]